MNLTVMFLDEDSGTFLKAGPERLQVRQLEPNKAALGVLVDRPKVAEDGTPVVGETSTVFVPLINYPMNISAAKADEPLVQEASSIPSIPVPTKKAGVSEPTDAHSR